MIGQHVLRLKQASIPLCALLMAQSPHCYKEEYIRYEFQLAGCPGEAFALPDTAAWDKYELTTSKSGAHPGCSDFKLYDLVEDQKGFANPDLRDNGIYVGLERGRACRLHVLVGHGPPHAPEPDARAEAVAKLVMYDSGAQPEVPAVEKKSLGVRETFQRWCSKREAGANVGGIKSLADRRCG